jgi:hypothetical protein
MARANRYLSILVLTLVILLATACGLNIGDALGGSRPPTPVPMEIGIAQMDEFEMEVLDTSPIQVNVIARGMLPDTCTQIGDALQSRRGSDLFVVVQTARPEKAVCPQTATPYEHLVSLEIIDLPAGIYVVDVNGHKKTLALQRDNLEDPATASIGGRVWDDLCTVSGGEGEPSAGPSAGCVPQPDGSYIANGLAEPEEPGVGGVTVDLGSGPCPAADLATVATNGEGNFTFNSLTAGTYCVTVNALSEQNSAALIPGQWTYPPAADGQMTVAIAAAEANHTVNFGWDRQFLPAGTAEGTPAAPEACTDAANYVADVTVPDDTRFRPGASFTKTWRLRNAGTCVWDGSYAIILTDGEAMGTSGHVPLTGTVQPGEEVEVSADLVAPAAPGTYRGNWMLRNASGSVFGLGAAGANPFWVQIVVAN